MNPSRIQLMNEHLINHIAAGEVIERPAAVLKELLENSYDAGATEIVVTLEKGGLQFLSVTDNGHGIYKGDLELAVLRHATSKLKKLEDLNHILSMGFRGEALSAIAAVSRCSLISRTLDDVIAHQVDIEGGLIKPVYEVMHPVGTTIKVSELFFNTPARRQFLCSEKTEFAHIDQVICRFVLVALSTEIKVIHNHKQIYHFLAIKNAEDIFLRFKKILGENFLKNIIKLECSHTNINFWGWLNSSTLLSKHKISQYLYLNDRPIRDRLIQHAVKLAYSSAHLENSPLNYVLYLELNPTLVDVNVHPTKQEVRFKDKRWIHDFITQNIFRTLSPPLDPKPDNENVIVNKKNIEKIYSSPKDLSSSFYQTNTKNFYTKKPLVLRAPLQNLQNINPLKVDHSLDEIYLGEPLCLIKSELMLLKKENTQELVILNIPKAKNFLFNFEIENYLKNKKNIPLVIPIVIFIKKNLNISFFNELKNYGIFLEEFSKEKIIIRNVPSYFQHIDSQKFFDSFFSINTLNIFLIESDPAKFYEKFLKYISDFWYPVEKIKDLNFIIEKLKMHPESLLKQEKIFNSFNSKQLMAFL